VKRILIAILLMLAAANLHAEQPWLDGKVLEKGFTDSAIPGGDRVPSVTVELLDPQNSSPFARRQLWIVAANPGFSSKPGKVDLSIGAQFRAYRVGEGSNTYGLMRMQYIDSKGHIKFEHHVIISAL
jgi:hypothetical protein